MERSSSSSTDGDRPESAAGSSTTTVDTGGRFGPKHEGTVAGIHRMMDAFVLEAVAGAGVLAVAIATGRRKPATRRPVSPPAFSIARSIRNLRRRHRRAVRAVVDLANACLERHPAGSFESFTAREALQTYLPETLAAYSAVPRELRRMRRAGRPSADDELSRQLLTLYRGLEQLRDADAAVGETRMAANGAFLNERFAAPDATVALGHRSVLSEFVEAIESTFRRT